MTAALDPEVRFPGLPDGWAYAVAAVVASAVEGPPALVTQAEADGCPFPSSRCVLESMVSQVEDLVLEVDGWTDAQRDEVFAAVDRIRPQIREVTR